MIAMSTCAHSPIGSIETPAAQCGIGAGERGPLSSTGHSTHLLSSGPLRFSGISESRHASHQVLAN